MSSFSKIAFPEMSRERTFEDLPTELRQTILRQALQYRTCRKHKDAVFIDFEAALQVALVSQTCFLDITEIFHEEARRMKRLKASVFERIGPTGNLIMKDDDLWSILTNMRADADCIAAGIDHCHFHQKFKTSFDEYGQRLECVSDAMEPYQYPQISRALNHPGLPYSEHRGLLYRILKALQSTDESQDMSLVIEMITSEFHETHKLDEPIEELSSAVHEQDDSGSFYAESTESEPAQLAALDKSLPSSEHGDAKCKPMRDYVNLETANKSLQQQCDDLEIRNKTLQEQHVELEASNETLRAQNASSKAERTKLQDDIEQTGNEAQNERYALEQTILLTQAELETLQKRFGSLKAEHNKTAQALKVSLSHAKTLEKMKTKLMMAAVLVMAWVILFQL